MAQRRNVEDVYISKHGVELRVIDEGCAKKTCSAFLKYVPGKLKPIDNNSVPQSPLQPPSRLLQKQVANACTNRRKAIRKTCSKGPANSYERTAAMYLLDSLAAIRSSFVSIGPQSGC